VAISLGTSDTCFGTMAECRTDPAGEGHVFVAPTGGYMSLICFKNGSLARERVRDLYHLDWGGFSRALATTPPGNEGKLMLPYFEPEIVPRVLVPGVRRFGLREDDVAGNCRAVVEAQMLSMRRHSAWMGVRPERIFATGGASRNLEILQVMADVHECPVFRFEVTNSAALGAALRAAHAWHAHAGRPLEWDDVVRGFCDPVPGSEVRPRPEAAAAYLPLLDRLATLSA
jgi:xylulokinase